jgi:hypothetical protein
MTLNLAQLDSTSNCRKLAAQAFELMPDRREAIALLTCYAIIDKDYRKALTLVKLMEATPLPLRSYWSQNNLWYGWRGDQLSKQVRRLNDIPVQLTERICVAIEVDLSAANAHPPTPTDLIALRDNWFSTADSYKNIEVVYEVIGGYKLLPEKYQEVLKGFACLLPEEIPSIIGVVARVAAFSNRTNPHPLVGWDRVITQKVGELVTVGHITLESLFSKEEIEATIYKLN